MFALLSCSVLCFGQYGGDKSNTIPASGGSPTVALQDSEDSANATTKALVSSGGMLSGGGASVVCMANSSFTSTLTFTDTGSNTGYQQDLTFTGTGYADFIQFYSAFLTNSIAPGGSVTVHFSNGGSENWHCYLLYLSALASTSWFDQSSTHNNTFGATQNPGTTSATTNANDFCIPAFLGEASGWGTVTWNSGYAQLSLGTIVTAGRYAGVGWKTLSATGTQTMTIGITASDNADAAMACYKQ